MEDVSEISAVHGKIFLIAFLENDLEVHLWLQEPFY